MRSSDIDVAAWSIGMYVRSAIVSAFQGGGNYPEEPLSIRKKKEDTMTSKDRADQFREYLKHYKRAPVKGGEK